VAVRPRVFVSREIPTSLAPLTALADVDVWAGELPPSPEVLRARLQGCAAVVCLLTERIDAGLLAACPELRIVSNMAVGVDNIDVAACTARGIPVGHTPGVLTDATADMTWR
jgi:glyoxylate reductase